LGSVDRVRKVTTAEGLPRRARIVVRCPRPVASRLGVLGEHHVIALARGREPGPGFPVRSLRHVTHDVRVRDLGEHARLA